MILTHPKLNNILKWEETQIGSLVIESPALLTQLVQELTQQTQGEYGYFVISQNNKELSYTKDILFIKDLFDIDLNQKKLLTGAYNQLNKNANEQYDALQQIQTNILQYINTLLATVNYPLTTIEQLDINVLLKCADVRFENSLDLCEQILDLITASQEFLHIKLFIFLGLKTYITQEQRQILFRETSLKKACILLIDSQQQAKDQQEKTLLVDKDLCEIIF